MTTRHDPDRALSAWLEEGPNVLPEVTRRAIEVGVRATRQVRRRSLVPWWRTETGLRSQLVVGAFAVVVALGGFYLSGPGSNPLPAGVGAAPPTSQPSTSRPSTPIPSGVPAMTEVFRSSIHGYSVRYPAGWMPSSASTPWWPPAWKQQTDADAASLFDVIRSPLNSTSFRVASATAPDGVSIDSWVDTFMTFSDQVGCAPARITQPTIVIDGYEGRVRDSCGEVEATVAVERRVYMFTLFGTDTEVNGRAGALRDVFDAFAATIDLRPEDALDSSPPPD